MTQHNRYFMEEKRYAFWVRCKCKTKYRSLTQVMFGPTGPETVTDDPCPGCSRRNAVMNLSTEENNI